MIAGSLKSLRVDIPPQLVMHMISLAAAQKIVMLPTADLRFIPRAVYSLLVKSYFLFVFFLQG